MPARAAGRRAGAGRAARSRAGPADVSPLAAVIGIALLGGMLLIGVLIGRGGPTIAAPAPVVQVGEASTATATTPGAGTRLERRRPPTSSGVVTSEWPAGTDGFTIQLSTLPKSSATPESVDAAKQGAIDQGAPTRRSSTPTSTRACRRASTSSTRGVYTDRKEAEAALKGLGKNFPDADRGRGAPAATTRRLGRIATSDPTTAPTPSTELTSCRRSAGRHGGEK